MNDLRENMPQGYIKRVQAILPYSISAATITKAAKYPGDNKDITEALAWVGIENILSKMLQMPNR